MDYVGSFFLLSRGFGYVNLLKLDSKHPIEVCSASHTYFGEEATEQ